MSKAKRFLGAAALLAVALFIVACGDKVIDDQKAEDAIAQSLEKGGSLKVKSVDCPSDVDVEAGKIFRCEVVTSSGQKATAVLKIRNEDADVDFVTIQPHN